jgi:hypothetical protein
VTGPVDDSAPDDDETAVWLSVPGLQESLAEIAADYAAGRTCGEEQVRARYGMPTRNGD